jgi:hypothetical protein
MISRTTTSHKQRLNEHDERSSIHFSDPSHCASLAVIIHEAAYSGGQPSQAGLQEGLLVGWVIFVWSCEWAL